MGYKTPPSSQAYRYEICAQCWVGIAYLLVLIYK